MHVTAQWERELEGEEVQREKEHAGRLHGQGFRSEVEPVPRMRSNQRLALKLQSYTHRAIQLENSPRQSRGLDKKVIVYTGDADTEARVERKRRNTRSRRH